MAVVARKTTAAVPTKTTPAKGAPAKAAPAKTTAKAAAPVSKGKPFAVKSAKTGKTYFLHEKEVQTPSGIRTIRYFASAITVGLECPAIPAGYTTFENPRTGMPMLKTAPVAKKAAAKK